MKKAEVISAIEQERFIAILRTNNTKEAIEKGSAVYEEGGKLIEVTFTVPNPEEAIIALKEICSNAYIGAGTVTNIEMCKKALEAGAEFIVSPNFDPQVAKLCAEKEILYIPGVMTPTEIVNAFESGHSILKLFPGEILGPMFVRAMRGPFPSVKFVVTGGVSLENLDEWFREGVLAVGMGGSLVSGSKDDVKERVRVILQRIKTLTKSQ